ncbi:hypothetical protein BGZ83_000385 [Gryganskiella cystojenkinii]|nr:hypothetical protein BGZ83_000385 [Gryganskiella cystojenkinii]
MNSPPPLTSRANRRRAHSLDNPTTPLLASIGRRRSDRRVQDEVAELNQQRRHVSAGQCWLIYLVLISLYASIVGIVYYGRRPNGFVPALPDMKVGETLQDTFNPHTALVHLEAITTRPHPFNSRANSDLTRQYIRHQFEELQAEALALGRLNVRYDDGQDYMTWTRMSKSRQQREMEDRGETEVPEGERLIEEEQTVVQSDNMLMWVGGVTESRDQDGKEPVLIEIGVDDENQSALMISAHFDSVSTSYGATDDGGGVAVSLALIRHFIHHPVKHTLVFFLNNAEEDGSLGASAFMGAPPNSTTETGNGHPWKKYIKAFLNLEGGGAGGPSLLFRGSNSDIVRQYADHAPFPHASVFASDAFSLGLLASDTDYSIYVQHNIPGLDIAFYRRRAMYHSTTDDLPIESLYHMGSNVQATIKGLCNSPYLDRLHSAKTSDANTSNILAPLSPTTWFSGKSVFYDVIGKFMILTELWSAILINGLALGLGLPVLALTVICSGSALRSSKARQQAQRSHPEQNPTHSLRTVLDSSSMSLMGYSDDGYASISSRPSSSRRSAQVIAAMTGEYLRPRASAVLRTVILVIVMVAIDIGVVIGAAKWQWQINPYVRHSHPWLVLLAIGLLLMLVNTFVVYVTTALETLISGAVSVEQGAIQWTFALGLWWWVVVIIVGTGVSAWAGTGALYGTTVLAVFSGAAAILQVTLNQFEAGANDRLKRRFAWVATLVVGLAIPTLVILDLTVVISYMTAQSFIRADSGIMYLIYGTLMIPIVLAGVPVISRARNFKWSITVQLLLVVGIAWYLSLADPYTAEDPGSLYYIQRYNQTTGASTVRLRTDAGEGTLLKMIQHVPFNYTGSRSSCAPTMSEDRFMEECEFSPLRQVFEDPGRDQPLHIEWTVRPERTADGWRHGQLQILALESRFCTVSLAQTRVGEETQLWMDGLTPPGKDGGDREGEIEHLNHREKYLRISLHEWNRAWSVHVRVRDTQRQDFDLSNTSVKKPPGPEATILVPIQVICGYEDWSADQGYATAFNSIRTHIPDWTRMQGNSIHGLFSSSHPEIQYYFDIPMSPSINSLPLFMFALQVLLQHPDCQHRTQWIPPDGSI